uniref:Uncharacterized protein n=1 Tax=Tanacetum cinerariifolium TaxID=118510 RepID=A0A699W5F2_TANCI|nr:hypothetical protein [Tanacetum cinerariifolium]
MIDQGVTTALAARDARRSTNDDDSHNSGRGVRRTERAARECTYTDFLKYDDGQILLSKRDQETRNGNLGAESKGYLLGKLYPTLPRVGFIVRKDVF